MYIGGAGIGIIRTDDWLDDYFHEPLKICQKFMASFSEETPDKIYRYLLKFGMYRPNQQSFTIYEEIKEKKYWDKVEGIFNKYRKIWKGPDVSIYIFPINTNGFFLNRAVNTKSGVSFSDKIFLFIAPLKDDTELEALFVHEYHHVCRLNKQKKKLADYDLLDSIILEGLAEHAVEEYCGKDYRTKWCTYYTRKEILYHWEHTLNKELNINKNSRLHDQILYGEKFFPAMIGYAAGYEIIALFKEQSNLAIEESFQTPSKSFIPH